MLLIQRNVKRNLRKTEEFCRPAEWHHGQLAAARMRDLSSPISERFLDSQLQMAYFSVAAYLPWRFRVPRSIKRREHPLSMRLSESDVAIIDRAATLRGCSRTGFVREAAVRAAEDVLMETLPIKMSRGGFKAFIAVLSGPATPVPELIELFQRTAPWETTATSADG
jgi:uncharacterized protein (DUF1778 family)